MEMKNVYAAFVRAQRGFSPALKTSTNPHFKSRYADLAACVEAVLDSLNEQGIGLVQRTHQDDTGVTVETLFVHESGEVLSGGTLHVPAPKQDPQGYGSALSYARRYSLMSACGIAPEDDDGNAASKKSKTADKENGSPGALMFAQLQPEVQDLLRKAAPSIDAAMPDVAKAVELIEMTLDNFEPEHKQETKAGLWFLLDSKTRSAIKKYLQENA